MVANYNELLQQLIASALKEDIGEGDHSTLSCISPEAKGKAVLKIKEAGVLAGMKVAEAVFRF
ncbi:MAG: nicotinate-nucleotide diphosphorylase (carboxylating), partial [Lacibacter sp.]|nr:nicotinate-nucleotide diphosphorylase (carboxylating) [Lacibacter sp.]